MTEAAQMMQAIVATGAGGPDVLRLGEAARPAPRERELLIKVAAAGVNRPDLLQRQGLYPPPPGAPDILGLEIAGQIVARGPAASHFGVGERVLALVPGGGYAQYCLVDERNALPIPAGLSIVEAAAIPETFFTVWTNVFERGRLKAGETLLVHGGTSGIGTMAIMLGRAFGLEVIVTCGGADKCAAARKYGAHHAIDYKNSDFVEEVARITGGQGVNLVLDMVAGDYVMRNLKCLAEDGRHVTIAVQGGVKAELNMAFVMSRRLTLTGSTLRPRTREFKSLLAAEIAANAWPLFETGELRPVMDQTFPLARAAAAHARMESGTHIGKIVLEVGGEPS